MTVWLRTYIQSDVGAVANPADEVRGCDAASAARTIHVAASAPYHARRRRQAAASESKTNARSNSATITGAVTIDSLQAMPAAQASTASASQRAPGSIAART